MQNHIHQRFSKIYWKRDASPNVIPDISPGPAVIARIIGIGGVA